ncbi:MAG: cytochrome b/b6 domain-containing protein [Magnetococcus sp. THC-1_WYH]
MTQTTPTNIIVWDWPTRLFHWLLVATFGIAFATSGDDPLLGVHLWSGFLFFGLIVFRIVWGFIGTRHARFSDFVASPAHVIAHIIGVLHRHPQRFLGHNPAGGWAILLLLGLGLLLALCGFLVLGGQEGYGLFAGLLTFAQGHQAMEIHEAICFSCWPSSEFTGPALSSNRSCIGKTWLPPCFTVAKEWKMWHHPPIRSLHTPSWPS